MARIERVRVPAPTPRGLPAGQVQKILAVIPRTHERDRLLFGLIASTGLRAGEALSLYVEDLDLTTDDEHLSVLGKGDRRRTVLLDDPQLVATLRRFLARTGYRHGPLFRAQKNGRGGPLSYQSHAPEFYALRWILHVIYLRLLNARFVISPRGVWGLTGGRGWSVSAAGVAGSW